MKHTHRQNLSNKAWIAVFAAVAVLCFVSIFLIKNYRNTVAVIYQNGVEVGRVDLSGVTESYTIPLKNNVILVEPGGIRMQSANCPDQICVHQGVLHDTGRIVCLPNRVMIEMERGRDTPDAKAG